MFSCWHQCRPLGHLLLSIFLHYTAVCLVVPALTDITMSALCPGDDECSQAIYLTGLQQAISGIGTMLVTPILGGLSDKYGRKALLMVPMTISIVPLAVLAYSRSKPYVYTYFVLKTLAAVVSEGGMHCISLAYVISVVTFFSNLGEAGLQGSLLVPYVAALAGVLFVFVFPCIMATTYVAY